MGKQGGRKKKGNDKREKGTRQGSKGRKIGAKIRPKIELKKNWGTTNWLGSMTVPGKACDGEQEGVVFKRALGDRGSEGKARGVSREKKQRKKAHHGEESSHDALTVHCADKPSKDSWA